MGLEGSLTACLLQSAVELFEAGAMLDSRGLWSTGARARRDKRPVTHRDVSPNTTHMRRANRDFRLFRLLFLLFSAPLLDGRDYAIEHSRFDGDLGVRLVLRLLLVDHEHLLLIL